MTLKLIHARRGHKENVSLLLVFHSNQFVSLLFTELAFHLHTDKTSFFFSLPFHGI